MQQLMLKDELLFTVIRVAYHNAEIEVSNVLVDTGSATTILSADIAAHIGIIPEPTDMLHTVRGIGGTEAVFTRWVDYLQIDQQRLVQFEVEIGGMDYGFDLNGILGLDFLIQAKTVINLRDLRLEFLSE